MKTFILPLAMLLILATNINAAETLVAVVSKIQSPLSVRISEQLQLRMFDTPEISLLTHDFEDKLKEVPQLNVIKDDQERTAIVAEILEVDFVVQLEYDNIRNEPSGYWIREAGTGTLLTQQTLPNLDPGEIAGRLAKAIRLSVKKANNPNTPKFAFVGTVADDVSDEHKAAVRPFSEAVNQQLAGAPELMFVGHVAPSVLLASDDKRVDIDIVATLTMATDPQKQIVVTTTLRKSDLEFIAQSKTTGRQFDAQLVHDVVHDLCLALKTTTPSDQPDSKLVAAKFFSEAQYWWKQKDFERALVAGETALFYQPDNERIMTLLSEILLSDDIVYRSGSFARSGNLEAEKWSKAELQKFVVRGLYLEGELIAREKQEYFSHTGDANSEMFHRMTRLHNLVQRLREQSEYDLTTIEMHLKESYQQSIKNLSKQADGEEAYFPEYTRKLIDRMSFAVSLFPDLVEQSVTEWVDLFLQIPDDRKPWMSLADFMERTMRMSRHRPEVTQSLQRRLAEQQHPLAVLYADWLELVSTQWNRVIPAFEKRIDQLRPLRVRAISIYDNAVSNGESEVARGALTFLQVAYEISGSSLRHSKVLNKTRDELLMINELILQRSLVSTQFVEPLVAITDRESSGRAYGIIENYIRICRNEPHRLLSPAQQKSELEMLTKAAKLIKRDWPRVDGSDPNKNFELRMLFSMKTIGGSYPFLFHPRRQGDFIHAMIYRSTDGNHRSALQLVSIPINDEKPKLGGVIYRSRTFHFNRGQEKIDLSSACVTPNGYYLVSREHGIVRFDFDEPVVETLPVSEVLPDEAIHSITEAEGVFYIGTENGSLLQFGENDTKFTTLAAARREPAISPLDGRPGIRIDEVLFDSPRKRLILLINERSSREFEFWEYSLEGESFRKLREFPGSYLPPSMWIIGDTLLMASHWIIEWDLRTDKAMLTASRALGDLQISRVMNVRTIDHIATTRNSVWWLENDGGLHQLKNDSTEAVAHYLDLGQPPSLNHSSNRHYLAPFDRDRFLMYNQHQLWLVHPLE